MRPYRFGPPLMQPPGYMYRALDATPSPARLDTPCRTLDVVDPLIFSPPFPSTLPLYDDTSRVAMNEVEVGIKGGGIRRVGRVTELGLEPRRDFPGYRPFRNEVNKKTDGLELLMTWTGTGTETVMSAVA